MFYRIWLKPALSYNSCVVTTYSDISSCWAFKPAPTGAHPPHTPVSGNAEMEEDDEGDSDLCLECYDSAIGFVDVLMLVCYLYM